MTNPIKPLTQSEKDELDLIHMLLSKRKERREAAQQNSETYIIKDGLGMGSPALQKKLEKYKAD